jgi:hypothetical protein
MPMLQRRLPLAPGLSPVLGHGVAEAVSTRILHSKIILRIDQPNKLAFRDLRCEISIALH